MEYKISQLETIILSSMKPPGFHRDFPMPIKIHPRKILKIDLIFLSQRPDNGLLDPLQFETRYLHFSCVIEYQKGTFIGSSNAEG